MSYPGYPPNSNQPGYPPQGGYGGYPPQQGGYPPQQGGYPPQQGGYPPQQGGYPPQQPGAYPPAPGGGGYPPSSGGIGFENLGAAQPPAQNYGGANPYPPSAAPGGYPPSAAPGGYPPSAAPGGYPPAQAPYYPPSQQQQPAPGYGAPPPHQQQQGYGAQAMPSYGATAPGYGGAPPPQHGGYHQQQQQGQYGMLGASVKSVDPYQLSKATKKMSEMQIATHGTVKTFAGFNAEQDAQVLRKAMKGLGTDEKAITNVIGYRTNKQRQQIITAFKQAYGKDLIKELKSEVGGNYERLIVGLMSKPADYDAYCLHKAMSGAGTDESVLIEILASRSNKEIAEIKDVYKTKYKKVLEKELSSETSGHFRRLLVSLNNGAREESLHVDASRAEADAQNLYKAGEKKWGTDEAAFNLVMASRSHPQLRATFQAYHRISNRDITKSLEGEFSGDILKGMLAVVGVARDPPSYFATQFYKSMRGMGTNDDDLIRAVVTRSEVDMQEIKQRFEQMYKQPLSKFISDDTSGDYKKLLLAVVGN